MTVPQAVSQLLEIESLRGEGVLDPEKTLAVAVGRVGGFDSERILAGPLSSFLRVNPSEFGPPLHSLVIVGKRLHHLEVEYGEMFAEKLGEAVSLAGLDTEAVSEETRQSGRREGRERWRKVAREVYSVALD